jgi:hypothetical protein
MRLTHAKVGFWGPCEALSAYSTSKHITTNETHSYRTWVDSFEAMDSPTILQDRSDMPQSDRKAKAFKKRRQVRNHPKACADNAAGSEDEESRAGGVASAARRGTNTTCSLKCPYYKREPKLHQRTSCKFISYGSMRGVKYVGSASLKARNVLSLTPN